MTYLKGFGRFWYDFIVGDDWRLALAAIVLVPATALAVHAGVNAWWLLPLGVAALLALSVVLVSRGGTSE